VGWVDQGMGQGPRDLVSGWALGEVRAAGEPAVAELGGAGVLVAQAAVPVCGIPVWPEVVGARGQVAELDLVLAVARGRVAELEQAVEADLVLAGGQEVAAVGAQEPAPVARVVEVVSAAVAGREVAARELGLVVPAVAAESEVSAADLEVGAQEPAPVARVVEVVSAAVAAESESEVLEPAGEWEAPAGKHRRENG
jgi:hypothetical protein